MPFELYASFLPLIEDLEIARILQERTAAGPATPLEDTAAKLASTSARSEPWIWHSLKPFESDLFALPSRALMKRALILLVEVSRGNLTGQRL